MDSCPGFAISKALKMANLPGTQHFKANWHMPGMLVTNVHPYLSKATPITLKRKGENEESRLIMIEFSQD